jgi:predicted dienelactone hydrolase
VLLYSGDGDKLVAFDKNAAALARKLPIAPDFKLLAGAGHFVFMAPCNEDQFIVTPALCTDADGVDREDIHRNLISEAGSFFSRTLGKATRAGMQTADQ